MNEPRQERPTTLRTLRKVDGWAHYVNDSPDYLAAIAAGPEGYRRYCDEQIAEGKAAAAQLAANRAAARAVEFRARNAARMRVYRARESANRPPAPPKGEPTTSTVSAGCRLPVVAGPAVTDH